MLQGRNRVAATDGRRADGHDRVLAVLQENAASLLRLARQHSLCSPACTGHAVNLETTEPGSRQAQAANS